MVPMLIVVRIGLGLAHDGRTQSQAPTGTALTTLRFTPGVTSVQSGGTVSVPEPNTAGGKNEINLESVAL